MSDKKMDEDSRGMLIGGLITLGVGLIFLLSNLDILPSIGRDVAHDSDHSRGFPDNRGVLQRQEI